MKSIFLSFTFLISQVISGQTTLVIEGAAVPFKLVLDGISITDSSSFVAKITIEQEGAHLLDLVFDDESQTTISRTVRTEKRTELLYRADCAEPVSFIPVHLLRFSDDQQSIDTLLYRGQHLFNKQPVVCHFPVSDTFFKNLIDGLRQIEFDFQREKAIRNAMSTYCFSVKQLKQVLLLVEFEDKRLAMASEVKNCCTELPLAHRLAELFVFEKNQERFLEYLK